MSRILAVSLGTSLVIVLAAARGDARPFRVNQVPNGTVNGCLTCHESPGGPRNAFGSTIEFDARFLDMPGGNVLWQPALAAIDSDGDGRTNGDELLDPAGTWTIGTPNPGNPADVGRPGVFDVAVSVPALPPVAAGALFFALLLAGARAQRRKAASSPAQRESAV